MDIGSILAMLDKIKKSIKKMDEYAHIWLPTLLLIIVFYPISLLSIPITILIVCNRHISEANRQRNEHNGA